MKIIDGYNVIGAGQDLGLALSQPDKEQRLLRLLISFRSRRRIHERMLVVFDGHHGKLADGPRTYSHAGIDVEWAISESADAVIIRRVRGTRHPQEIEVVTADALLLRNIENYGAKGLRSGEFLEKIREALMKEPEDQKPPDPSPSEVADWIERFERGKE